MTIRVMGSPTAMVEALRFFRLGASAVSSGVLLEEPAKAPDARALFATHQQRQVNIALWRLESSALITPYVLRGQTLRIATRYRLQVQVGRRLRTSLVEGDIPLIDPLLPEPQDRHGHVLHVAVYA